MSNLAGLYNEELAQQAGDGNFDPIPEGFYKVIVNNAEMKQTNDGQGSYLNLTLDVLDGSYKNRKVFARMNLQNKSEKAMAIAHREFGELCEQVGLDPRKITDTSQLINKVATVKVVVKYNDYKQKNENEVGSFKKEGASEANPPAQPQQQAGAATEKPW